MISPSPMISLSMSETRQAAMKAARGAFFSWGIAGDAAFAVVWLERHGLPGMSALIDLCDHRYETSPAAFTLREEPGLWSPAHGELCPVRIGTFLFDLGTEAPFVNDRLTIARLNAPLLILPFASRLAGAFGRPVSVAWEGTEMICDRDNLTILSDAAMAAPVADRLDLRLARFDGSQRPGTANRCRLSDTLARRLDAFVQQTYVPDSEESRLRGAGAGLVDND